MLDLDLCNGQLGAAPVSKVNFGPDWKETYQIAELRGRFYRNAVCERHKVSLRQPGARGWRLWLDLVDESAFRAGRLGGAHCHADAAVSDLSIRDQLGHHQLRHVDGHREADAHIAAG